LSLLNVGIAGRVKFRLISPSDQSYPALPADVQQLPVTTVIVIVGHLVQSGTVQSSSEIDPEQVDRQYHVDIPIPFNGGYAVTLFRQGAHVIQVEVAALNALAYVRQPPHPLEPVADVMDSTGVIIDSRGTPSDADNPTQVDTPCLRHPLPPVLFSNAGGSPTVP